MITNRRSFLSMMFGGLVAAPVVPVSFEALAEISDFRVFKFVQNFDFESDQSLLMRVPPDQNFFIQEIGLWFDPQCLYEELIKALDSTWLEILIGNRTYMEAPLGIVTRGTGRLGGQSPHPVKMNDELKINLLSAPGFEGVEGVKGQMIIHGLTSYLNSR